VRAGRGKEIKSTFEHLLGRKARTYDAWMKSNVKAFQ
jgi:hypothetical protein